MRDTSYFHNQMTERQVFAGDDDFADPGGRSALRASSRRNPRNLPCPNCKRPNMLTPADKARGYQCDRCADAAEGLGCGFGDY